MPMATLNAVAEKGEITGATADVDPTDDLNALAEAGIDMGDVTTKLLKDGVEAFVVPFDKLLAGVESVKEAIVTGRPPTIDSVLPDELEPPIAKRAEAAVEENVARRAWRKDETLWGGPGPEIGNRLGWLTISEPMLENAPDLKAFALELKKEGYTDAALLGMGGSSLGPEVIRRSFGKAGGLALHVLDSTDPGAIRELESRLALEKTIFIVSSKSGGTVETLSHMKHFYEASGRRGEQFVAVTDPGSGLVEEANDRGFRRVFQNDPNIGGRYSVLSYFGLVPAALAGVDIEALLESSREAEENCNSYDSTRSNSGLWMGLTMGELALRGRDKLTFVVDEPISSFGLWVEQLIAESTGKEGKGILPVADEPLGSPGAYGDDRVIVHLANSESPDEDNAAKVDALAKSGQAVIKLSSRGVPEDLGRIFFFAEFATAVAGWALGINPFDQPNVQEAKDKTNEVLHASSPPEVSDAGDDELKALLGKAAPPHYVAIMGYVKPSPEFDEAVLELRSAIRDATKATTTFGYGPRFLHSTGQLHKGGPPTGLFLQLIHDGDEDVDHPRRRVHLRGAEERPGHRRPADPARPRPAGRARAAGGPRPGEGAARADRADSRLARLRPYSQPARPKATPRTTSTAASVPTTRSWRRWSVPMSKTQAATAKKVA